MSNVQRKVGLSGEYGTRQRLSAVFDNRPIPSTVYFHASQINSVVTDLLFSIGRVKGGRGFMKPCKRRLTNRMRLLKTFVVILRV